MQPVLLKSAQSVSLLSSVKQLEGRYILNAKN